MNEDVKLLQDIMVGQYSIPECALIYSGQHDNNRLYVHVNEADMIFHAVALEFVSCDSEDTMWKTGTMEVRILFHAKCLYDGIRHLEFNRLGTSYDGYLYYPPMGDLVQMLSIIREIEVKMCGENLN